MDGRTHLYRVRLDWTGARGVGTTDYRAYLRDHVISAPGKPDLVGSSDTAFRGSRARWNPEELLVASLSACHQLWYLHLCAENGVVVLAYADDAEAVMCEQADGAGQFESVTLHPYVTIAADSDAARALHLHDDAGANCFIARSVKFPVHHAPTITVGQDRS